MACCEYKCINIDCGWYIMTNEDFKKCPRCGGKLNEYFDEYPEPRVLEQDETNNDDYDE